MCLQGLRRGSKDMVQGPAHRLRPHNVVPAVYRAGPQQTTHRDGAHGGFMKTKTQACEEGGSPPCLFLKPPSPSPGALGKLGRPGAGTGGLSFP